MKILTMALILSTDIRIGTDYVMRPRSSGRGRNKSASVTVTNCKLVVSISNRTKLINTLSSCLWPPVPTTADRHQNSKTILRTTPENEISV